MAKDVAQNVDVHPIDIYSHIIEDLAADTEIRVYLSPDLQQQTVDLIIQGG
jgi:hypothetical protein